MVTATGLVNVWPSGCSQKALPIQVPPVVAGPPAVSEMEMVTSDASAPAGITILTPLGCVTVPPAAPTLWVTVVASPPASVPPPESSPESVPAVASDDVLPLSFGVLLEGLVSSDEQATNTTKKRLSARMA